MSTLFLTCLALACGNSQLFDRPKVDVDRIEINHFWGEHETTFNGQDIALGKCIFDQVVIWKIDEVTMQDEVLLYKVIRNVRAVDRIEGIDEKEAHLAKLKNFKLQEMMMLAHKMNATISDVIIYTDSEYIGPDTTFYRIYKNDNTNKYEITFPAEDIRGAKSSYTFCANSYVHTNTLFDSELEWRKTAKKGINSYLQGFKLPQPLREDRIIEQLHWRR